jgi:hypothetical protein
MGKAMNLYFTDEDRANIEIIRKALATKGVKFTDQKGNNSTSALLRHLIDEKAREFKSVKATP